jgi:hypothetical protein
MQQFKFSKVEKANGLIGGFVVVMMITMTNNDTEFIVPDSLTLFEVI